MLGVFVTCPIGTRDILTFFASDRRRAFRGWRLIGKREWVNGRRDFYRRNSADSAFKPAMLAAVCHSS